MLWDSNLWEYRNFAVSSCQPEWRCRVQVPLCQQGMSPCGEKEMGEANKVHAHETPPEIKAETWQWPGKTIYKERAGNFSERDQQIQKERGECSINGHGLNGSLGGGEKRPLSAIFKSIIIPKLPLTHEVSPSMLVSLGTHWVYVGIITIRTWLLALFCEGGYRTLVWHASDALKPTSMQFPWLPH